MKRKYLGLVCLLYSAMVLYVYLKKYLNNYLSLSMQKYILITSPILIIMGIVLIIDKHDDKFKLNDLCLLLPVFMIFLSNDGRLTTSLANNRANNFSKKVEIKEEVVEKNDYIEYDFNNVDYDVVDEAYAALTDVITYNTDFEKFVGKTIRIKGFTLVNTNGIPKGYFAIGKYIISCCAADATYGGFISKYDGDINIEENKWYEVEGVLDKAKDVNGYDIIIINVVNLKQIDGTSEEIYVYPCYSYDDGMCNVLKNYDLGF